MQGWLARSHAAVLLFAPHVPGMYSSLGWGDSKFWALAARMPRGGLSVQGVWAYFSMSRASVSLLV